MPTKYPQLSVKKRKILGRKVKKLREAGILPANLYGKKIKSQALQVEQKEFVKLYKEVGETGLLQLKVEDQKPRPVLVHNLCKDPARDTLLHVDFREVDLKQKTTAFVPLELVGEAPAVAIGGVLVQILDEVEVEALPQDLPEKIEVDISSLASIDQALTVADLVYDKAKIEIKNKPSDLVVKIEPPAREEEKVEEKKVEEKEGKVEEKEGKGEPERKEESGKAQKVAEGTEKGKAGGIKE